jgi:hypothetical protein
VRDTKSDDECVPLSVFAVETLLPGAEPDRTEMYVKTYVRGVKDLAKYVAAVDKFRTNVVETHLKEFLSTLSSEQQAVVKPLYGRIVDMMPPSGHLHRIHVDQSEFNHQN